MKKGIPKIKVSFRIDENSILTITAVDETSNKCSNIVIKNETGRLKTEDIDRMISDAKKFAEQDEILKKSIEDRTKLEKHVATIRQKLDTFGLSEDNCKTINDKIDEIYEWLESNDFASSADYNKLYSELSTMLKL